MSIRRRDITDVIRYRCHIHIPYRIINTVAYITDVNYVIDLYNL